MAIVRNRHLQRHVTIDHLFVGRRAEIHKWNYRPNRRIAWGWLLFLISLFFLWVTFNGLFMLPSSWDAFVIGTVSVSAVSALVLSVASGRLLRSLARNPRSVTERSIFLTFPVVFCSLVLFLFLAIRFLLGW